MSFHSLLRLGHLWLYIPFLLIVLILADYVVRRAVWRRRNRREKANLRLLPSVYDVGDGV